MMKRSLLLAAVATLGLGACTSMNDDGAMASDSMGRGAMASGSAMGDTTVGGAPMFASKTIVENASQSPIHTTLVSAVSAAGLVPTLSGPGPFTVFAPTDDAFGKLPAGTVDTLVMPANRSMLSGILTYHVVPGRLTASQLRDGQRLTTASGGTLTVVKRGNMVHLRDARGGESMITQADVMQSNGVIHVIDTVLMPAA